MKVAVSILRWFPWGGLQLDCRSVLEELVARGHEVTLLTLNQESEVPEGVAVHELPAAGLTNHRRVYHFGKAVRQWLKGNRQDVHLGFNKIPGLDLYFAGDSCFVHKARTQRPAWYRWLPRYRQLAALEAAVFAQGVPTRLLMISRSEAEHFSAVYGTEPERMVVVPPALPQDALEPLDRASLARALRAEMTLPDDERILLFVGSGFEKKGLDRAVFLVADLLKAGHPVQLLVAGKDRQERYARIARGQGVAERVHFLGGRDDVRRLMGGSDLLIHPARDEAGPNVLLEALAAGLPVVATSNCGLAEHVATSGAGAVADQNWTGAAGAATVAAVLAEDSVELTRRALEYVSEHEVSGRAAAVADELERWVQSG